MGSGEDEAGGIRSWGGTERRSSGTMSILWGKICRGWRGSLAVSEEAMKWTDELVVVDGLGRPPGNGPTGPAGM